MEKNMLNKVSTAGVVLSVAALVSLSGVFGANAQTSTACGYGYGYDSRDCNSPDFLLPGDDSNVTTNGGTIKTGNDDNTSDQDKETTTEDKEETTTTTEDDRIVKVDGDKVYTLNNKSCGIAADIANPNFNADKAVMFTDISNSQYEAAIKRLARVDSEFNEPIVHGTTPTTYEPSRSITRAEFLAIVLQSHCVDVYQKATSTPFADLEVGDWKTNVVAAALKEGVIYGDTRDGVRVFRPNDAISKIEAMAILTSMRDIQIDADYTHSYTDAAADWQNRVLSVVEYLGLEPKASKFNPNSTIARDAMAHYIVNAVELY